MKKVFVINKSKNPLPEYAHKGDAGMDLRADFSNPYDIYTHGGMWDEKNEEFILFSGGRAAIPTGLYFELPKGCELQIRGRSGLAIKSGIYTHVGTLDENYRGECAVIIYNLSNEPFYIKQGDRIGQAILNKYQTIVFEETKILEESDRGENGFGSSGVK